MKVQELLGNSCMIIVYQSTRVYVPRHNLFRVPKPSTLDFVSTVGMHLGSKYVHARHLPNTVQIKVAQLALTSIHKSEHLTDPANPQ